MKRGHLSLVCLFCCLSFFACAQQPSPLCDGKNETLECLRLNFDALYTTNDQRFWRILHAAKTEIETTKASASLLGLLMLVRVAKQPAEFEEFLNRTIEEACIGSPALFRNSMIELDSETRKQIENRLASPMFVNEKAISSSGCKDRRHSGSS